MTDSFVKFIKFIREWLAMVVARMQEVLTWIDGKEDEWEEINAEEEATEAE
ncbi:MAG: hypothetical protein IJT27_03405 [Clostridia bacterium]|nr:hypothetical protein [Clostridia bacterium]